MPQSICLSTSQHLSQYPKVPFHNAAKHVKLHQSICHNTQAFVTIYTKAFVTIYTKTLSQYAHLPQYATAFVTIFPIICHNKRQNVVTIRQSICQNTRQTIVTIQQYTLKHFPQYIIKLLSQYAIAFINKKYTSQYLIFLGDYKVQSLA